MADENESGADDETKKSGILGKLFVWGIVFVLGAGTGIAVPLFILPSDSSAASGYSQDDDRMDIPDANEKLAFVDFDEVVVNLNDSRYSRYLTCTFSLQIAESQQEAIEKLIDENKVVLKNWLIAHLRDKKLEDVQGKLGHNLLRREIHDRFNEMLLTEGIERIQDVLFQDFKIQ